MKNLKIMRKEVDKNTRDEFAVTCALMALLGEALGLKFQAQNLAKLNFPTGHFEGEKLDGKSFEGVDWMMVYRLAVRQDVVAIAWEGLQRLMKDGRLTKGVLPLEVKIPWAMAVEQAKKRYEHQRGVIKKLARFYNSHSIKMMILKGYGLSLCYPQPECRQCSDVDIWLFGEQERGDDLLRKEHNVAIDENKHHHTVFQVDRMLIENHYDFINVQSHLSNREVERLLQKAAHENSRSMMVDDVEVWLPSAEFHALFLLRHSAMHFAAQYIDLRHLLDWVLFVKAHHAEVDWRALRKVCVEQNMHRFLNVMNTLAVDILGVEECRVEGFEREDELEERVMKDIIHPEFPKRVPDDWGLWQNLTFKLRRWWGNRWKHYMVYREGLFVTFVVQIASHLYKPASLK